MAFLKEELPKRWSVGVQIHQTIIGDKRNDSHDPSKARANVLKRKDWQTVCRLRQFIWAMDHWNPRWPEYPLFEVLANFALKLYVVWIDGATGYPDSPRSMGKEKNYCEILHLYDRMCFEPSKSTARLSFQNLYSMNGNGVSCIV